MSSFRTIFIQMVMAKLFLVSCAHQTSFDNPRLISKKEFKAPRGKRNLASNTKVLADIGFTPDIITEVITELTLVRRDILDLDDHELISHSYQHLLKFINRYDIKVIEGIFDYAAEDEDLMKLMTESFSSFSETEKVAIFETLGKAKTESIFSFLQIGLKEKTDYLYPKTRLIISQYFSNMRGTAKVELLRKCLEDETSALFHPLTRLFALRIALEEKLQKGITSSTQILDFLRQQIDSREVDNKIWTLYILTMSGFGPDEIALDLLAQAMNDSNESIAKSAENHFQQRLTAGPLKDMKPFFEEKVKNFKDQPANSIYMILKAYEKSSSRLDVVSHSDLYRFLSFELDSESVKRRNMALSYIEQHDLKDLGDRDGKYLDLLFHHLSDEDNGNRYLSYNALKVKIKDLPEEK
jgi:hypothetical protein